MINDIVYDAPALEVDIPAGSSGNTLTNQSYGTDLYMATPESSGGEIVYVG